MPKQSLSSMMEASGVHFGTSGARGLVDSLSDELCFAITLAFLQEVFLKNGRLSKVVIGHDLRSSSPRITSYN